MEDFCLCTFQNANSGWAPLAAAGPQDKDGVPTELFSRPCIVALAGRSSEWAGAMVHDSVLGLSQLKTTVTQGVFPDVMAICMGITLMEYP